MINAYVRNGEAMINAAVDAERFDRAGGVLTNDLFGLHYMDPFDAYHITVSTPMLTMQSSSQSTLVVVDALSNNSLLR